MSNKIIIARNDFSIFFIIKINWIAFCFDDKVLPLNFLNEMNFYFRCVIASGFSIQLLCR